MRKVYLTRQHFIAMLCVAFAVHVMAGVTWALSPALKVNKIPVHVLNIKLGSGSMMTMTDSRAGAEGENIRSARVASQPKPVPPPHEAARDKPQPKPADKGDKVQKAPPKPNDSTALPAAQNKGDDTAIKAIAPASGATTSPLSSHATPSQYVRGQGSEQGRGYGSALGNSVDPQAEVMRRYTQLLSAWIYQHSNIFVRAVPAGMKGNIVVEIVIDRSGNIQKFMLFKGMEIPAADNAALAMVRASNPVPPVPRNYPAGNLFQFRIPVKYDSTKVKR